MKLSAGSTYAEYNFDKEDGDASKNKYNAVSAEHATYTEGKVGKALSMESDTYIETPLDKSPAGTSLSFWVKKAAGGSSDEHRFCLRFLPHLVISWSKPFRKNMESRIFQRRLWIIPLTITSRKTNGYI